MEEKIPHLISILEEQHAVSFTGKINFLDFDSRQLLGVMIIKDGNLLSVRYQVYLGLKAFFQLLVDFQKINKLISVIEPEVITDEYQNIHYPLSTLKLKAKQTIENALNQEHLKPPMNYKLIPLSEVFQSAGDLSKEEFDVLSTLCDWNKVEDLYKNCQLLDFEITQALVNLRKKKALKVMGTN